jgi:hypothetical protein
LYRDQATETGLRKARKDTSIYAKLFLFNPMHYADYTPYKPTPHMSVNNAESTRTNTDSNQSHLNLKAETLTTMPEKIL